MSSTNKKGAGLILSLLTAVAGAVGLAFCMAISKGINSFFIHNIKKVLNVLFSIHVRKAKYISHTIKLFAQEF